MIGRQTLADRARHGGAAGHGERAALAEVILDIDDDQCAHGANGILRIVTYSPTSAGVPLVMRMSSA